MGQGAYFYFEKQPNFQKRNLNIYLKTNNNRNCNSNNTDGECLVNVRDLKLVEHVPMKFSFVIFTFLQKARSKNKVKVKVNGSRRLENGLVVPGSFLARTTSRVIATKF